MRTFFQKKHLYTKSQECIQPYTCICRISRACFRAVCGHALHARTRVRRPRAAGPRERTMEEGPGAEAECPQPEPSFSDTQTKMQQVDDSSSPKPPTPTLLTSWTHANGCTDPACADPECLSTVDAKASVATAAADTGVDLKPAVCRHWWRKGSCLYGDSCKFGHPPHETLPPWPRRSYRQQTYNAGRVGIFRRWIVETFGLELLRGGGVLDVRCRIDTPLSSMSPSPATCLTLIVDCRAAVAGRHRYRLQEAMARSRSSC